MRRALWENQFFRGWGKCKCMEAALEAPRLFGQRWKTYCFQPNPNPALVNSVDLNRWVQLAMPKVILLAAQVHTSRALPQVLPITRTGIVARQQPGGARTVFKACSHGWKVAGRVYYARPVAPPLAAKSVGQSAARWTIVGGASAFVFWAETKWRLDDMYQRQNKYGTIASQRPVAKALSTKRACADYGRLWTVRA